MIQGTGADLVSRERAAAELAFPRWDKARKVVDELIDLSLNYRQSWHPGGSRSKVHLLIATLLSGAMHWDLLRPWRPFQDRFVLPPVTPCRSPTPRSSC
jgi:hypothetical protein